MEQVQPSGFFTLTSVKRRNRRGAGAHIHHSDNREGFTVSAGTRASSSSSSLRVVRAPENTCGMSERDVTVLPLEPASMDLPRHQQQHTLTRLYSQNGGHHLRISPDGSVSGGRQENDPYDVLRLQAVSVGVVVIIGEMASRYLAMDNNGHLYASQTLNDECYFLEKYEQNHHNTYRSQKYSWYVALKRNGEPKPLAYSIECYSGAIQPYCGGRGVTFPNAIFTETC